jgi:hypothetical protein
MQVCGECARVPAWRAKSGERRGDCDLKHSGLGGGEVARKGTTTLDVDLYINVPDSHALGNMRLGG